MSQEPSLRFAYGYPEPHQRGRCREPPCAGWWSTRRGPIEIDHDEPGRDPGSMVETVEATKNVGLATTRVGDRDVPADLVNDATKHRLVCGPLPGNGDAERVHDSLGNSASS